MSLKSINHSAREGRQAERRFWPLETQGYEEAAYQMQKLSQVSENRLWKLTEEELTQLRAETNFIL